MNIGEARAKLRLVPDPPPPEPPPGQGGPPPGQGGPPPGQPPGQPPGTALGGSVSMPSGHWARYAAKLGTALTVTVSASAIRKGGHEPNDPDDDDCRLLSEALEEGLRLRFGDTAIPWWLGAALAAGGVYAGMRVGAKKLEPEPAEHQPSESVKVHVGGLTPSVEPEPEPGEQPTPTRSIFAPPIRPTKA